MQWLCDNVSYAQVTKTVEVTGSSIFLFSKPLPIASLILGSAPATREIAATQPGNSIEVAHGIYLGGGSAMGVDSAQGAVRYLRENSIGVETKAGCIPVVPGACIFDLVLGIPVPPSVDDVYNACKRSTNDLFNLPRGSFGAGTGAMVSKLTGNHNEMPQKGGIGWQHMSSPCGIEVWSFTVVNAFGRIISKNGEPLLGHDISDLLINGTSSLPSITTSSENTTLAVVFTNFNLSRNKLLQVGKMASAGFARALSPCFTPVDGDVLFIVSTQSLKPCALSTESAIASQMPEMVIGEMAAQCIAESIRSIVPEYIKHA